MDREPIHSKIKSLVLKFEANKYHYLSKNYLEEEVKIDFINPLFEALGWDVGNTKGLSPFERDVVVEKGETLGRPDYNFRIDGQTKFFMEVKAPHELLIPMKPDTDSGSFRTPFGAKRRWLSIIPPSGRNESRMIFVFS
jgi:hypothetical protein